MSYAILLVEDNPHIMAINREALMMEDYAVLEATDGEQCMRILQSSDVDLIVLDIMLPDGSGLELCRRIKAQYDVPILFLSALGENGQIIQGLRAGGDDYLAKPYDLGVLLARIEARLRASAQQKRYLNYGNLRLDTISMIGYCKDADLLLTQKEFVLLQMLIRNATRVVTKEELYQEAWGAPLGGDHSVIHTSVSRLNKKLDAVGAGYRVGFRRGEGYVLEDS